MNIISKLFKKEKEERGRIRIAYPRLLSSRNGSTTGYNQYQHAIGYGPFQKDAENPDTK